MRDRRRFLQVAGVAAVSAAVPGCAANGSAPAARHRHTSSTSGAGGAGGGGDVGGGDLGGAGGGSDCTANPAGMAVGAVSDFPNEGLYKVPGTPILIGRDADGFYALSAICTHQGCNMNKYGSVQSSGIQCLCHGSRFGDDGHVINGPAYTPLPAYALAKGCDGTLYADPGTEVPSTDRLPP